MLSRQIMRPSPSTGELLFRPACNCRNKRETSICMVQEGGLPMGSGQTGSVLQTQSRAWGSFLAIYHSARTPGSCARDGSAHKISSENIRDVCLGHHHPHYPNCLKFVTGLVISAHRMPCLLPSAQSPCPTPMAGWGGGEQHYM